METNFTKEFENAKIISEKYDVDDILAFGPHYFECGYNYECYYNHSFAVAIAIIGKLYSSSQGKESNYHKGVAYIAKELQISKRQIKVIRKKFLWRGGYIFKTPYTISEIILKMISLLDAKKTEPIFAQYLLQQSSDIYREMLIEKQYAAIKASARHDQRVNEIRGELENIIKKAR